MNVDPMLDYSLTIRITMIKSGLYEAVREDLHISATSGGVLQISLRVTFCRSVGLIIFMNILHTMAHLVMQHR
jgi:hypothetical protein